jgi:hypothetical protein
MKSILIYMLFLSVMVFSCKGIISPTDPYIKWNGKIYYENINIFSELYDVDTATFKTISRKRSSCEDNDYGKDKNSVYYKKNRIAGADAESFEALVQGYFKDKRYIYFHGKVLEDSDSRKRIEIIDGQKDQECIPWGDGGCVLNNGILYQDGKKR